MPPKLNPKKIRDAKRKLVIRVTKGDVHGAKRANHEDCAVARAIKRCFHANQVVVAKSRTYVQMAPNSEWDRYETPEAIRTEMVVLDRGAAFQEDEYTLRPLRPSARKGARGTRADRRAAYTGRKRSPIHIVEGVRARIPYNGK